MEYATCRGTTRRTAHCVYSLKVTTEEAAELEQGTWYTSTPATANDGGTVFQPRTATFGLSH
ncbi:DUF5707 domain-containing protein [Streptomyces atroolivaceus]|uniref:DUF5707 domain-containing protein n=1 Tax=Streptomyces atroolivaceus TaxID=66869 RepID=UPI003787A5BB